MAAELIAAAVGPVAVLEADHARYIVHTDGSWEYRFPIRLFASLLRPKLEGFRQQWDARPVEEGDESFASRSTRAAARDSGRGPVGGRPG